MNGRIKELIKDAWDYDTNSLDEEMFAELIVRECAEICLEDLKKALWYLQHKINKLENK